MSLLSNLHKLLGGQVKPAQPIPLGKARPVEGYWPQDVAAPGGEAGVDNYLQPSYQSPQVSLHGGLQQGQPNMGMQPTVPQPYAADPFGWNIQLRKLLGL